MSNIQAVLNEFMPCGGTVCPGCEVACKYVDGRTPDADRMADAIIDLRAECEALRQDAARYRWLRDNKEREVAVCDIDVCYYLDGLDAYIDAALAVQP